MWMFYGVSAGLILGLYDFWTKKAIHNNSVLYVIFFSSFFGAFLWGIALFLLPLYGNETFSTFTFNINTQIVIFIKSLGMCLSWIFAFYSVKQLSLSFSGSIRASGPIWAMLGGFVIFGEVLSIIQIIAVMLSVLSYYLFVMIGKKEGIKVHKSLPIFFMLMATFLSAAVTIYDKYMIQNLNLSTYEVQSLSSFYRALISLAFLIVLKKKNEFFQWNRYIIPVGAAWVIAEWVYFFALLDPVANVTYLSIFRRMSLPVSFLLSILFLYEDNIRLKTLMILGLLSAAALLVFSW